MASRLALAVAATMLCACGSSAAPVTAADSATTSASSTSSSATTAASPAGTAPCGPAGARTFAASGRARVYATGGKVYACARGTHKRYTLGVSGSCLGRTLVGPATVNGVLAAYATERCGVDTGSTQVVIRRLSDGKILAQPPATATNLGPESHVAVTALVLAGGGAAAWISAGGSIVSSRTIVEVQAYANGTLRRLDRGGSIDRRTLRLSGTRLRWRHGSTWRTARLG